MLPSHRLFRTASAARLPERRAPSKVAASRWSPHTNKLPPKLTCRSRSVGGACHNAQLQLTATPCARTQTAFMPPRRTLPTSLSKNREPISVLKEVTADGLILRSQSTTAASQLLRLYKASFPLCCLPMRYLAGLSKGNAVVPHEAPVLDLAPKPVLQLSLYRRSQLLVWLVVISANGGHRHQRLQAPHAFLGKGMVGQDCLGTPVVSNLLLDSPGLEGRRRVPLWLENTGC